MLMNNELNNFSYLPNELVVKYPKLLLTYKLLKFV